VDEGSAASGEAAPEPATPESTEAAAQVTE